MLSEELFIHIVTRAERIPFARDVIRTYQQE